MNRTRGESVLVAVHNTFSRTLINSHNVPGYEALWISVKWNHDDTLIVGLVDLFPNSPSSFDLNFYNLAELLKITYVKAKFSILLNFQQSPLLDLLLFLSILLDTVFNHWQKLFRITLQYLFQYKSKLRNRFIKTGADAGYRVF